MGACIKTASWTFAEAEIASRLTWRPGCRWVRCSRVCGWRRYFIVIRRDRRFTALQYPIIDSQVGGAERMKKIIVLASVGLTYLLLASADAWACWPWSKVDEKTKPGGQVICTWKCGTYPNFKYTTTTGTGRCPEPSE